MVRGSAVHDAVTVEEDAFVVDSIVGEGARIAAGTRVESKIVGVGAAVA